MVLRTWYLVTQPSHLFKRSVSCGLTLTSILLLRSLIYIGMYSVYTPEYQVCTCTGYINTIFNFWLLLLLLPQVPTKALIMVPSAPTHLKSTHILPHALSVLVAFGLSDAHLVHTGVQYLYRAQTLLPVLRLLVQVLVFGLQISTGKRGPMHLALRRRLSGRAWEGDIRTSGQYIHVRWAARQADIASLCPPRALGLGCAESPNISESLLFPLAAAVQNETERHYKTICERMPRPKNISAQLASRPSRTAWASRVHAEGFP